ncbi:MAG: DNA translocase FtsK 4TM domain-containing protein [Candidatus Sumerlaeaceae bacterium]
MNSADTRRENNVLGLRPEVIDDVLAIIIILFGIFLLLSLATHSATGNLMGALGEKVYDLLSFIFGKYVAYVPVLLTLLWGISFWRRRRWHHVPARVAGGFFAIVFLCALLAIPYADVDFTKQEGFRVAGALGNFLVHRECLDLRNLLGVGGCYLIFSTLLAVSLIVAANIHTRQVARVLADGLLSRLSLMHRSDGADDEADIESDPPVAAASSQDIAPRKEAAQTKTPVLEAEEEESLDRVEESDATRESMLTRLARVWRRGGGSAWTDGPGEQPSSSGVLTETEPVAKADPLASAPSVEKEEPARTVPVPASEVRLEPLVAEAAENEDLLSAVFAKHPAAQLPLTPKVYEPPPLSIFQAPQRSGDVVNEHEVTELSEVLVQALANFGIEVSVARIECGPTIVRIEVKPAPGVKISRITSLEADIARAMKVESLRIIAPIPGRDTVGFEIPNKHRRLVRLREVIESRQFREHESPLALALGVTTTGEPYIGDLASMPHLLIAGATGSGKSVCLNSLICSILFRMPPDEVKFIMIDPKRVELNMYHDIPHLLAPVVCDAKGAAAALKWAVYEMESRYEKLAALRVRNIAAYNSFVRSSAHTSSAAGQNLDFMPYIVIVIDELADLILTARNEIEDPIVLLAQKSRGVGMHLVVATQRPSVNVITGIIKANFPCRIAFKVAQKVDSRTILDANGAENLLGRGDMLFAPGGGQKPIRLQGCYASDAEVESLTNYLREQQEPQYWKTTFIEEEETDSSDDDWREEESSEQVLAASKPTSLASGAISRRLDTRSLPDDTDPIDEELIVQAIRVVLTHRLASTSLLQRKLRVGFARAGRLMDKLEELGIVGPSVGPKPRDILVDCSEWLQKLDEGWRPGDE